MSNHKMKTSALLGEEGEEVQEISLNELVSFHNHPFQIIEDESFQALVESIQLQGVAMPIIVRPKGRGTFEIIAGHRRTKACEQLGLETIPAFIRDLNDDEAVLAMVDTNIQREQLLPSEKAFAYKMKLDALNRQGKRSDLMEEEKLSSREVLSQNSNDSSVQIQRYIRLTYLISELLSMTDRKKLPFQTAVELSHLREEEQRELFHAMETLTVIPSLAQANSLKKISQSEGLSQEVICSILEIQKEKPLKLSMKTDMRAYFSENTSQKEMEQVILGLLEEWKQKQSS